MISLTCSLAGMTVTVPKERCVEMLQKFFPEDSPDIWSESSLHVMECLKYRFPERLISLMSEFIWPPRSPQTFLSLGLYERWNQEKNIPATYSQMKDQVKEIIVSITAEILQRVIGKFSRRIQNCIVAREILFEK